VPNEEKILSLYETDVHVIVRKKAGAEVEFGNTLFLAENPQGAIIDWELFAESAPADAALLPRSVARMQKAYAPGPKALGGDRGFDSELNRFGLKEERIFNAVCPRSPRQLRQRNRSWKFKRLQRRRAQTEGRIAILKNVFLGGPDALQRLCAPCADRDLDGLGAYHPGQSTRLPGDGNTDRSKPEESSFPETPPGESRPN
jgi:hypothetical protein